MTSLDPEHPNPIEKKSDRELVRNADPYSVMEMTVWLVVLTIVIGAMTLVRLLDACRQVVRRLLGLQR